MKKILLMSIFALALLTSCGHGGLFYGEGITFSANTSGINFIRGKGLWDLSRENTSLVIESASGDGVVHSGENSFNSHFIIKKTVGKQILGYTVDLSKQSPKAVQEWLKDADSPKAEKGSLITQPEAKQKYVAPSKESEAAAVELLKQDGQ